MSDADEEPMHEEPMHEERNAAEEAAVGGEAADRADDLSAG